MWRWTVEQDRRSVGVEGEGMERTRSKQHRGVSWNLWNDRLFVVGLPQTMSRPLRAVSRRLLGVSGVVALLPECRRGLPSVHRGAGLGSMPGAWNEVGCNLYGWEERGSGMESVRNVGGSEADRYRRLGKASAGCRTYRCGDAPDTVTKERCRDRALEPRV